MLTTKIARRYFSRQQELIKQLPWKLSNQEELLTVNPRSLSPDIRKFQASIDKDRHGLQTGIKFAFEALATALGEKDTDTIMAICEGNLREKCLDFYDACDEQEYLVNVVGGEISDVRVVDFKQILGAS